MSCLDKSVPAVAIYSIDDDSWFELPPIAPKLGGVNPFVSNCVGLDGNVYLLEVRNPPGMIIDTYVFDLAGQRQWRKCAAMGCPEGYSEYGVLDGKIYSLGGYGNTAANSRGSNQVYDPVKNTWSPINPMRSLRMGHDVRAVGDELYVFGGAGCDEFFNSDGNRTRAAFTDKPLGYYQMQRPTTVQIYHPLQDEWRVVAGFHTDHDVMFGDQGNFYGLSSFDIKIYDLDSRRVTLLHAVSPELLGPADDGAWIQPIVAVAVGEELLAIVIWHKSRDPYDTCDFFVIRCKGLGSLNETLIWQRTTTPRFLQAIVDGSFLSLCHIYL